MGDHRGVIERRSLRHGRMAVSGQTMTPQVGAADPGRSRRDAKQQRPNNHRRKVCRPCHKPNDCRPHDQHDQKQRQARGDRNGDLGALELASHDFIIPCARQGFLAAPCPEGVSGLSETMACDPARHDCPRDPRLAYLGICFAAATLTVFSAMFHGSHAEARLDGPSGWTAWVVFDVVLVPVPLVAPVVALALLQLRDRPWRTALTEAMKVWLVAAMGSCALAVFWI